jgi:glycosyltransferase involved in cell wall biosynthesis
MIHVVLPNDIDDPARPSGGNVYDRRICQGLVAAGWPVHEHPIAGAWPSPGAAARLRLHAALAGIETGAVVLLDGLVASPAPEILTEHAARLRLVVLVHLPLGYGALGAPGTPATVDGAAGVGGVPGAGAPGAMDPTAPAAERDALHAAAAVIATSEWTRLWLLDRYGLDPRRLHVVAPGVDPAPATMPRPDGTRLLCVAAVAPHKGQDLLVEALSRVAGQPWDCVCLGPGEPAYIDELRCRAAEVGLATRITFTGAQPREAVARAYDSADLLVLASYGETYGMVVTEALARAVPVLVTRTGGVGEALGRTRDSGLPGLMVPVGDADALGAAVHRWLTCPDLRDRLRRRARERRETLAGWSVAATRLAKILSGVIR